MNRKLKNKKSIEDFKGVSGGAINVSASDVKGSVAITEKAVTENKESNTTVNAIFDGKLKLFK